MHRESAMRILAAADAAFPELARRDDEELMPKHPRSGRCRLCGTVGPLSREHVPPRAAFNSGRSRSHTFEEYIGRGPDGTLPGGILEQGGIWGYTLCDHCNNFTGSRYADEYRLWAGSIVDSIRRSGITAKALEASPEQPRGHITLSGQPRPGAFLREVLAMMCSISGGFDIAGRYPAIRRLGSSEYSVGCLPEGDRRACRVVRPSSTGR